MRLNPPPLAITLAGLSLLLAGTAAQSATAPPASPALPVTSNPAQLAANGPSLKSGSTLYILQSKDRAVYEWKDFSIGTGARVEFRQPGPQSIALNRVVTSTPSQILGQLNANGRIFIVNPNGVLFGQTAQVNVGSLLATTLDIDTRDFLDGRPLKMRAAPDSSATILNAGSVMVNQVGYVVLAAPRVEVSGLVLAPDGRIVLAAGSQASLDAKTPWKLSLTAGAQEAAIDITGKGKLSGSTIALEALPDADSPGSSGSISIGKNSSIVASQLNNLLPPSVVLRARDLINNDGEILAIGANTSITVGSDTRFDNYGTIGLNGNGAIKLRADESLRNFGNIVSVSRERGDVRLNGGMIENQGKIQAWGQAGIFLLSDSDIYNEGTLSTQRPPDGPNGKYGPAVMQLDAAQGLYNKGDIQAMGMGGILTLHARERMENNGTIRAGDQGSISMEAGRTLINSQSITANGSHQGGTVTVRVGAREGSQGLGTLTNSGTISANGGNLGGVVRLFAGDQFEGAGGTVEATGKLQAGLVVIDALPPPPPPYAPPPYAPEPPQAPPVIEPAPPAYEPAPPAYEPAP